MDINSKLLVTRVQIGIHKHSHPPSPPTKINKMHIYYFEFIAHFGAPKFCIYTNAGKYIEILYEKLNANAVVHVNVRYMDLRSFVHPIGHDRLHRFSGFLGYDLLRISLDYISENLSVFSV